MNDFGNRRREIDDKFSKYKKDFQNERMFLFKINQLFTDEFEEIFDDILILNETTQFRRVYVPVQGFNIPVYSSAAFGKTYDAIAAAVKQPKQIYEKIYVSRMAMQSRRTFGESVVQIIFEKNGYKIICPETLPLVEQIGLVKNARVLAGCAGTALHLALFMAPGGVVVQIKRNARAKCNADIQNLINVIVA